MYRVFQSQRILGWALHLNQKNVLVLKIPHRLGTFWLKFFVEQKAMMRFCGGSILKLRVERKRADATANFEDNAAHVRVHTIAKRTSNLALVKYTVKHLIGHGLEWFHVYGHSYS